ncbi:cell wall-binding repeat-containing protein [Peptostreptococcus faecalis]|uniref:cell wall-binding repeat-containing protein n=1 Tax=Peptostreptococcus faecalis TaxID=2045015 RepID=UPI000C79D9DB|nr:cell wall-binding repeat-containing protein [Peptostreptococcus faecalis]
MLDYSKLNETFYNFPFYEEICYVIWGLDYIPNYVNLDYYVIRLFESDRYKTATEMANVDKREFNKDIKIIVLVNGKDCPDALSSSLIATMNNGTVLLTESDRLNKDTREYIQNNNIENVIIVGSTNER